ncbi:uncharacterized protein C8R40DRAFT_1174204 [Lentinula edodes]|uniref:uncharacterized protein n=1 Tax=Lentinula edodes TaxID=5353 RepID=UPI001E8D9CE7|nr:uncharacterized protein C8R40DRAFT_1174204 [Lentinula edodes]KAH7871748.1 hypothetical protein C8R40DRAFT_1174204 [Lentinula edodes]
MSDDEEAHWPLESIIAAHVKRQGRGKAWEYRVRWKGYSEKDDTWEPVKSFAESEHFIDNFWSRTSKMLNGRDIKDLNAFKIGEEFFPVGPPLKKRKSRSAIKDNSPVASGSRQTPMNNKRLRTPSPTIPEEPSPKRARQLTDDGVETPSGRRTNRTLTSISPRRPVRKLQKEASVVPASEGEEEDEIEIVETAIASEAPPRFRRRSADNIGQNSLEDNEAQLKADPPVPAHRMRAANPLVHMLDDFGDMDGAIGVKARISGKGKADASGSSKPSTSNSVHRRKPGPGRSSEGFGKNKSTSSLLTFDKGQLKTVKGKYVATEIVARREQDDAGDGTPDILNDSSQQPPSHVLPPTSGELVQLVSRVAEDAEELQAFEETEGAPSPGPSNGPSSILQRSLSLAKESLFPSWSAVPFASAAFTKRPTIFGPLGSGSDVRPASNTNNPTNATQVVQTQPFLVTIDVAKKIPVVLTDLSPNDASILDKIVRNASGGPPGKFYSNNAALAILDTLRTGGASAKVIPSPNATESETQELARFSERLSLNELFVLMVGFDLLVFCSSSATLITQRLNIPTSLLSEPASLLVEQVSISNHSAYANAVLQANE